ncbi:NUDIX domain-containing protein [Frankia sp. CNm7]|uniref:NUDIX domain-containing protein n=1 Tax=Frankia nepalensis TaxID=1836974 RepID=A0A937UUD7_9ACTN|nr:NUDIX domain-containing protein [Frankia nepalensis]MBL7512752.1 NUDIX domain-containing protein [Frankia nepalensis]MBL7517824.1 NUDIX domain-containing protein [Frankia nepalensis]MBL7632145.1 NUDIX domain-containing protein [Frankia nepalensis]
MTVPPGPAASEDRRRTTRGRRGEARFTCLGADAAPPFEAVTSASVVAVADDGRLVLADLARGLDLPGGHVQRGDASAEETVRRETWEEVRAELAEPRLVEVIESDYFGPDDLTYMVIYVARVRRLAPWTDGHESAGRVILPPDDFLARYRGRRPELMRHLVTSALATLAGGSPAAPATERG